MGQIEIIEREWVYDDRRFWFELDGSVTVKTVPTTTKDSETITSKFWLLQKLNRGQNNWALQSSNSSKTNNHEDSCLNEYPDTAKELFCRFTAQIVEYQKPISFSPHKEKLDWNRKEK